MSNIIWIISAILIFNVSGMVLKELYNNHKSSHNKQSNIIRPDKIHFIIGACGTLGLLSLVIFAWFLETSSSPTEKYVCASLIIVFAITLGGGLMFYYLNYKIMVYEDYFIYQNFWRIKKTIYYKDIYIEYSKLYPQVRQKLNNGKSKLIFKLAGILNNEDVFIDTYEQWLNKHSTHEIKNSNS